LQALPVRLCERGRGDHARDQPADRAQLPALRPAARHPGRLDHDDPVKRALLYIFAALVALTILIPIIYAVLGGFRDTGQIGSKPLGLPDPWVWSNYGDILKSGSFWRQVFNSTLIAAVSTLLTVPLAALAAFVFARLA